MGKQRRSFTPEFKQEAVDLRRRWYLIRWKLASGNPYERAIGDSLGDQNLTKTYQFARASTDKHKKLHVHKCSMNADLPP